MLSGDKLILAPMYKCDFSFNKSTIKNSTYANWSKGCESLCRQDIAAQSAIEEVDQEQIQIYRRLVNDKTLTTTTNNTSGEDKEFFNHPSHAIGLGPVNFHLFAILRPSSSNQDLIFYQPPLLKKTKNLKIYNNRLYMKQGPQISYQNSWSENFLHIPPSKLR